MAKLNWEISRPGGYGVQYQVPANTRADAIAIAEAQWLADTDWEREVVGQLDDDGHIIRRSPIPEFVAKKIGRLH